MEWINVKDKLPNINKVLAIYKSDKNTMYNMRADGWFRDTIYSCRYENEIFTIESHGPLFQPTHWMIMPEAPKD